MSTRERGLVFFLRVFGSVSALALYAVVQPHSWMVATHEWLGLGPFPEGPIAPYLARSLSAFYAMVGGFFLLFSTDVRRFRPAIAYGSKAVTVFGLALLFIDLPLDLPDSWRLTEGPTVIVIGLLVAWLVRAVPRG